MFQVTRRALIAAALLGGLASTASAQSYPTRPVTLVVTQGVG